MASRKQIIKEPVRYGYNHSEIAQLFGYHRSIINKIMEHEV